jgi:phosphatidylglycerol:prolipoprotein diacylglycerol transferase
MIIAGVAALWVIAKIYKMSFLKMLDVFACGAILGQAIGRWGNFFNQEAFGAPTDDWLKLFIPIEKRPFAYMEFDYFHPAFLYESVLNLVIFAVLVLFLRKAKPGMTAALYLILYSLARIFVEQIRVDSTLDINGVPFAQIISVVIILAASIFMIKLKYVHRNN